MNLDITTSNVVDFFKGVEEVVLKELLFFDEGGLMCLKIWADGTEKNMSSGAYPVMKSAYGRERYGDFFEDVSYELKKHRNL
ncbi:MAG: hypothetical protein CMH62_00175 [Nanoarchaeota archaeon]|nr:hypothetical protein [Nanoarchaeota archaeon]